MATICYVDRKCNLLDHTKYIYITYIYATKAIIDFIVKLLCRPVIPIGVIPTQVNYPVNYSYAYTMDTHFYICIYMLCMYICIRGTQLAAFALTKKVNTSICAKCCQVN